MKKIIDGKVYNTETAKFLAEYGYSNSFDFNYWEERLYQKKTGEFFLCGEGGPNSRYAVVTGQNQWSGGEKIIPLSVESAQKWAEDYLDGEEYEEIFGEVSEDEEDIFVRAKVATSLNIQIKAEAAKQGITVADYLGKVITKALEG